MGTSGHPPSLLHSCAAPGGDSFYTAILAGVPGFLTMF